MLVGLPECLQEPRGLLGKRTLPRTKQQDTKNLTWWQSLRHPKRKIFLGIACSYDNREPWAQIHIQAAKVHILHKLPQMIEKEGKLPAAFYVAGTPLISHCLNEDSVRQEGSRLLSMTDVYANIPNTLLPN
jgi:hypothetical protein